jgi:hypothetical protein
MAGALAAMLALTLNVDSGELAALLRLSDAQLRDRFDLPASCDPALSARRRGPRTSIEVTIQCVEQTLRAPGADDTAGVQRLGGR